MAFIKIDRMIGRHRGLGGREGTWAGGVTKVSIDDERV